MPHTARAQVAALSLNPGVSRSQPAPGVLRAPRKRGYERSRTTASLITTPVLTELVKLTLSPSSVTNTNTIATGMLPYDSPIAQCVQRRYLSQHILVFFAVSQAVGPNYLVWYSILCALTASVGTWVVHLTSYLWHNVFEEYILQDNSAHLKVHFHSVPSLLVTAIPLNTCIRHALRKADHLLCVTSFCIS